MYIFNRTTINLFALISIIFSLSNAPPPPLIIFKFMSISSAPSIATSIESTVSMSTKVIPRLEAYVQFDLQVRVLYH